MVRKYQNGGPYISRAIQNIERLNEDIQQFFLPGMQRIQQAVVNADKRNAQFQKANARANKGVRAPMAPNNTARLQDELWRKGAFKGIKDRRGRELTYEQAVDGVEGGWTKQAMANAEAMKASQPSGLGETPGVTPRKQLSAFSYMYTPGMAPQVVSETMSGVGQRLVNKNPAIALANRYVHGALGLNATYTKIPLEHIDILSDQNLWIYDNWDKAFNYNLNSARTNLAKNQDLYNSSQDENERAKLLQEIENNKKSIANIQSNYDEVRRAGSLEKWLLANPGKKMVMGANFRAYKDNNAGRMRGLQGKYADFGHTDNLGRSNSIAYAMDTPLGQVEMTYGNNVQSYQYDPESRRVITRFSDTYDFNKHGNEKDEGLAKLRKAAGENERLSSKGSVKYSSNLKPITPGTTGQNYVSDFGTITRSDSKLELYLLKRGIRMFGGD